MVSKAINNNGVIYPQSFTYLDTQNSILVGKAGDGSVTTYIEGQGVNEHLAEVGANFTKTFATDHLGSVLNSDAAGAEHQYGLFGEIVGAAPVLSASSDPADFAYAGYMYDRASGNYELSYRNYSPSIGRWTSQEPSGSDSFNYYQYTSNNPLRYIDLDGLKQINPGGPSCEDMAAALKNSCNRNLELVTVPSACSVTGGCMTTGPLVETCAAIAGAPIAMTEILGRQDCSRRANDFYSTCKAKEGENGKLPPDILTYFEQLLSSNDIYEFFKFLMR